MRALKTIRTVLGTTAMLVVLSAWCVAQYGYPQSSYPNPQSSYPNQQSSYPQSDNGYYQPNQITVTQAPVLEYADPQTITIMWRTNVNANSAVRFSTDPNRVGSGQLVNLNDNGRTHRVEMRNRFQPGTTYYFQLISDRGNGDSIVSPVFAVQTPTQGSEPIRNQRLEIAGNNGLDNRYGNNDRDDDNDRDRGNRRANSQYANNGWRRGGDYAANRGYGRERLPQGDETSTSTIQITRPPMLQMLSDTAAVITWRTNAPSSSIVRYGTDPRNLTQTAQAPWGETMHTVNVPNLQPGTQYFFAVSSGQAQGTGTETKSATLSFTTQPQGSRPLRRVQPNPEQ